MTPNGQWDYERRARDRGIGFRLLWEALVASETLRRITLVLGLIFVGLMYYDISNVVWASIFLVIWIMTTVAAKLRRATDKPLTRAEEEIGTGRITKLTRPRS